MPPGHFTMGSLLQRGQGARHLPDLHLPDHIEDLAPHRSANPFVSASRQKVSESATKRYIDKIQKCLCIATGGEAWGGAAAGCWICPLSCRTLLSSSAATRLA